MDSPRGSGETGPKYEVHMFIEGWYMHSQLSRPSTARGSSTRLSLVGPTKVEACESFLFTEGSPEVENKEHLFDFVDTL